MADTYEEWVAEREAEEALLDEQASMDEEEHLCSLVINHAREIHELAQANQFEEIELAVRKMQICLQELGFGDYYDLSGPCMDCGEPDHHACGDEGG